MLARLRNGGMAMTWKDLIPWSGDRSAPDMSSSLHGKDDAPLALHQQMNRLLDNVTRNFSSGFGFMTHFDWPGTWPHFEVSDNDKEITIVAELQGFEENDVQIWVHDGGLTLKGEKKEEENGGNALSSKSKRKRRQFRRWLRLRSDVESNKVNTSFRSGVLTVTLAKRAQP
jgi:HSP20 family protein